MTLAETSALCPLPSAVKMLSLRVFKVLTSLISVTARFPWVWFVCLQSVCKAENSISSHPALLLSPEGALQAVGMVARVGGYRF